MKVGFAGRWSPLDKSAWSGTYFYSYTGNKKILPELRSFTTNGPGMCGKG